MANIEISAPRFEELDTMIGLMSEAFAMPYLSAREIFFSDPYFNLDNKRVLRSDGRIVSCLTIVDTMCWLGAGKARLAGIAGVATYKEERGKGYAGKLLEATIQELRRREFALSALLPFSIAYYRKFGWEVASFAHRYLTAPYHLPSFPEHKNVRLAYPDDALQLATLYKAATYQRTLHCLRDERRWRYILDHAKQRVVYAHEHGPVEGYLLCEYRTASPEQQAAGLPSVLRILEMRAATAEARRGLIGYLARQETAGCIEFEATAQDLTESGLFSPLANSEMALASVEIVPSMMARVIDFTKTLKALASNWKSLDAPIAFILSDALHPAGGAAATALETETGVDVTQIEIEEARRFANYLTADGRVWARVLTGHLCGDDACALQMLRYSSIQAMESAARLFPERNPFLPAPDHF